jgi:hypothetical protein
MAPCPNNEFDAHAVSLGGGRRALMAEKPEDVFPGIACNGDELVANRAFLALGRFPAASKKPWR